MGDKRDLFEAAAKAMAKAHAPYSDFPVGAALRTGKGTIFAGCTTGLVAYCLSPAGSFSPIQTSATPGWAATDTRALSTRPDGQETLFSLASA